ncbi:MAG: hypothetical protein IDH49_09775 [Gammaproteobacteria bacterium]|nr:hypothetical protein [Gammaproteobacteria bacterium]
MYSDSLDDIAELARQGAPDVALRFVDSHQPASADQPAEWARWERVRIAILQERKDWQAVVRRVAGFPAEAPQDFMRWAWAQSAAAYIELGQGARSRDVLLRLLWTSRDGVDSAQIAQWRRMVIRSYIADGRKEDAYTSIVRYQQDYGDADTQSRLLRAHVLLISGRPAEAVELLKSDGGPEARSLYLLARLRGGGHQEDSMAEAAMALKNDKLAPAVKARLWATLAEGAGKIGEHGRRIACLEQAVLLDEGGLARDGLFAIDTASVWDAYRNYARLLANQEQLLVGDFEPWFALAQRASDNNQPVQARALYALLALEADTLELRLRAHRQFTALLGKEKQGSELVRRLYRDLGRFS